MTVEELSEEIRKHISPDQSPHVHALLGELRARKIDLKEFCRRVRMLLGAEVLMNTVKGLQHSQQSKSTPRASGTPRTFLKSKPCDACNVCEDLGIEVVRASFPCAFNH